MKIPEVNQLPAQLIPHNFIPLTAV